MGIFVATLLAADTGLEWSALSTVSCSPLVAVGLIVRKSFHVFNWHEIYLLELPTNCSDLTAGCARWPFPPSWKLVKYIGIYLSLALYTCLCWRRLTQRFSLAEMEMEQEVKDFSWLEIQTKYLGKHSLWSLVWPTWKHS